MNFLLRASTGGRGDGDGLPASANAAKTR